MNILDFCRTSNRGYERGSNPSEFTTKLAKTAINTNLMNIKKSFR